MAPNMRKHLHHFFHLQLILIFLIGTQALSTNLRPFPTERRLYKTQYNLVDSDHTIICKSENCHRKRRISGPESLYTLIIGPGAYLVFEIRPDHEQEDLGLKIISEPYERLSFYLESDRPENSSPAFQSFFPMDRELEVITLLGPIGRIFACFRNYDSNAQATVALQVSHKIIPQNWPIPLALTLGAIFIMSIIALLYYRCRRGPRRYYSINASSQASAPSEVRQFMNGLGRRHRRHAVPKLSVREIINTCFPAASFDQFESSFPQKTCTICLEDMQDNQSCRQLECQHIFHSRCAKKWLRNQYKKKKKVLCPNCNMKMNINLKQVWKKKKAEEAITVGSD